MLNTIPGAVSMVNQTNMYKSGKKRNTGLTETKNSKFDSAQFSTQASEDSFRKEVIGRISQEVRTTTTTGDIQKYRREIEEGTYTLDPMAIAGRILLFSEE